MSKKIAFCAIIFPGNLIFFPDFLKSLESQTDKDFTLLLFNDGVTDIDSYLKQSSFKYEVINVKGSIAKVRTEVLQYLKNGKYQYVIFGDTDDYFSENRVAVNRLLLQDYQVVVNDLHIVNSEGKLQIESYWKNRKEVNDEITLESILEYNFIGLGNTAINIEAIPDNLYFEDSIVAVDWLLFSRVLQNRVSVCFTSEAFICYRQHDGNLVGRKEITLEQFKKGFYVKLNHYTALEKENAIYRGLAERYKNFVPQLEKIRLDEIKGNVKTNNPFWWEEIKI